MAHDSDYCLRMHSVRILMEPINHDNDMMGCKPLYILAFDTFGRPGKRALFQGYFRADVKPVLPSISPFQPHTDRPLFGNKQLSPATVRHLGNRILIADCCPYQRTGTADRYGHEDSRGPTPSQTDTFERTIRIDMAVTDLFDLMSVRFSGQRSATATRPGRS
jgi:hypothetical protein